MTNGERIKYLREKNGFTQKDIATKLGTVGYMKALTRIQVDKFSINDSYTLEKLEKDKENIRIISVEEIFADKEKVVLNKIN